MEYIFLFNGFIQKFNKILKDNYKFTEEPTYNEAGNLFPRKGTVISNDTVFNYQYHGSGCTLIVGEGIWINYNIDVINNNEIRITAWRINKFIETYTNEQVSFDFDEIDKVFLQLERKGVLIRRDESFVFNLNKNVFVTD